MLSGENCTHEKKTCRKEQRQKKKRFNVRVYVNVTI